MSSFWDSSATGTTAGDYTNWTQTTATDTGYYNRALQLNEIIQHYERGPMPHPEPEVVRLHELQEQRREPLERWRKVTRDRIGDRQKKEEAEASELAKRLLLEYLDEKNRKNFIEEKSLEVESGIHSGVKYHIPYHEGRIKAWKGDKVVSELCLQVRAPEWIPREDKILPPATFPR